MEGSPFSENNGFYISRVHVYSIEILRGTNLLNLEKINPSLAEHDMPCLSSADPDQLASEEAN